MEASSTENAIPKRLHCVLVETKLPSTEPVLRSPPMTSENDARSALEREIYWAEDASARSRMDTSEVRDLLHDFAMLMRADEKQAVPRGEPELGSGSRLRRKTKVLQFRLLRPMRRRNDRLLAEFGELAAALADRVVALETEVRELRAKVGDAE